MSQVTEGNVAGLRFWRHLRRKSATGDKKCRRSDHFCHLRRSVLLPAMSRAVICDVLFCHLQRSVLPPATLCAVTCDVLFCHLRRKSAVGAKKCRRSDHFCHLRRSVLLPAMSRAVICDVLFCHLQRSVLPPATLCAVTCDVLFCHLQRLITADGESEAAFHHETDGMDGKTIDVCPANTGKIVAYGRIEIDAQPGSDHELCTGAYACRPLE